MVAAAIPQATRDAMAVIIVLRTCTTCDLDNVSNIAELCFLAIQMLRAGYIRQEQLDAFKDWACSFTDHESLYRAIYGGGQHG